MTRVPRISLDSTGGDSTNRLINFIASIKQADSLAPVTVIGPSVYANLSLRHALLWIGVWRSMKQGRAQNTQEVAGRFNSLTAKSVRAEGKPQNVKSK